MLDRDLSQYCFLVVDDDDISRDLVGHILGQIGATRIFSSQDGNNARYLAQMHRPDFVLLDIYMPQVDGWALAESLRSLLPSVVMIMITGSHLPSDFVKSMSKRVDGYCIKPVLPDVMRKALTGGVRRQRASQLARL